MKNKALIFILVFVLMIGGIGSSLAVNDIKAKTDETIDKINEVQTEAVAVNPGEDGSVFLPNSSFKTIDGTCTKQQVENGCEEGKNAKIYIKDEKTGDYFPMTEDSPVLGYLKLDEDYTIGVSLEIWKQEEDVIGNIMFDTYYHGMSPIWRDEYDTICQDEPNGVECGLIRLSDSLNEIALYITCHAQFPKETYGLTDEQYKVLEEGYRTYVNNTDQQYKTVTGKCFYAPEEEDWDGNYYPNGENLKLN